MLEAGKGCSDATATCAERSNAATSPLAHAAEAHVQRRHQIDCRGRIVRGQRAASAYRSIAGAHAARLRVDPGACAPVCNGHGSLLPREAIDERLIGSVVAHYQKLLQLVLRLLRSLDRALGRLAFLEGLLCRLDQREELANRLDECSRLRRGGRLLSQAPDHIQRLLRECSEEVHVRTLPRIRSA